MEAVCTSETLMYIRVLTSLLARRPISTIVKTSHTIVAVRNRILSEQQKVAEYNEVRDEQTGVGMLEVVAEVSLVQQVQLR
jgi:hypothetical protein